MPENTKTRLEFLKSNKIKFGILAVLFTVGVLIYLTYISTTSNIANSQGGLINSSNTNTGGTNSPKALASSQVNKDFLISAGESATNTGKINYRIESADLQKEIIVKGQRASAVNNRAFLILNLKISNPLNNTFQMKTRDYIRLASTKQEGEWLAPEIHNDPVEIQAISTKYTRLGFAVDDNVRKFIIQVGEISGQKETLEITF